MVESGWGQEPSAWSATADPAAVVQKELASKEEVQSMHFA